MDRETKLRFKRAEAKIELLIANTNTLLSALNTERIVVDKNGLFHILPDRPELNPPDNH